MSICREFSDSRIVVFFSFHRSHQSPEIQKKMIFLVAFAYLSNRCSSEIPNSKSFTSFSIPNICFVEEHWVVETLIFYRFLIPRTIQKDLKLLIFLDNPIHLQISTCIIGCISSTNVSTRNFLFVETVSMGFCSFFSLHLNTDSPIIQKMLSTKLSLIVETLCSP